MNKGLITNIGVMAFFTAAGSVAFALIGFPLAGFVWALFAGFTITTTVPHEPKHLPNLLASQAAGWFWAMIMYYVTLAVVKVTGVFALGLFVAIFFGSIFLLIVHIAILGKSWFNVLPMIYTPIFCWFATQDFSKIIYIVIGLTTGSVLVVLSGVLTGIILGAKEEEELSAKTTVRQG
ncbi:MAG: hypothetical protein AAGU27_00130 [Dehalobacterium sp.]